MHGMKWQLLIHSCLHAILEVFQYYTTNVKENLKIAHGAFNFENWKLDMLSLDSSSCYRRFDTPFNKFNVILNKKTSKNDH
jgi:hypothetical protein